MSKQRRRHSAEQVVKKLRDADAMLTAGKSVGDPLTSARLLRHLCRIDGSECVRR